MAYRNNRVMRRDWICFVTRVFDLGTLAQLAIARSSRCGGGGDILSEQIENDRCDSEFHFDVDWLIGIQKREL